MVRDEELAHVTESLGDDLDALLVYSLLRTHDYLSPSIAAGLRDLALTAAQFNALLVLRAAPEGLRMGQLGEQLVVTKSNVTGLIDRLERQGLVQRDAEEDRRATLVRLSPAGEAMLAQALPGHAALLAQLTDCLDSAEKATLVRLLSKLRRQLRRRRQEVG